MHASGEAVRGDGIAPDRSQAARAVIAALERCDGVGAVR
jgi:hypothetical protein